MNSFESFQPGVAGRVAPRDLASRNSAPGVLSDLVRDIADLQRRSLLDPVTHELGLNEARYSVLRELHFRQPEGCSQSELAKGLYLSESNLSTLIDRMVRDGLLQRERSRLDRRKSMIRITSRGATLAESIRSRECDLMNVLWEETTGDYQSQLCHHLELAIQRGRKIAAAQNSLQSLPIGSHHSSEDQHAVAG